MPLRPLDPIPETPLKQGWDLWATEAGRTNDGLKVTVQLWNGTSQACRTFATGDDTACERVAKALAKIVQINIEDVTKALLQLIGEVENALRQQTGGDRGPSQATRLVELAEEAGIELFHTPEGDAYATIEVDKHKETWPLKVKGFRRWLSRLFYAAEEKAPGSQAVQDALGVFEGKALFDGPEEPVFTRLAEYEDKMYLDLANDKWQAVEISPTGWQVVDAPSVKFRRSKGMLPLPLPLTGGSSSELRQFVNVADDKDWILVEAWLTAASRPTGPYPVLVLHGEQGAAKSSLTRIFRSLIDPNEAMLRTTPRDERDLVIAATNGWVIALDNLSHLPQWLSDALCRLATGSGFATRELYSDAEEAIFKAQRPIVMNGIEELATRGDLLDRSILLYLPSIPEDKRQDEKTFWRDFEAKRPYILGALLSAAGVALANLPHIQLKNRPRMADFATWACAAAPAYGWEVETPEGELLMNEEAFLYAYAENRQAGNELALEASILVTHIRNLAAKGVWEGIASDLLDALNTHTDEVTKKLKTWPKSSRALGNALRRLAPNLRNAGIPINFSRENKQRIIRLGGKEEEELPF